MAPLQSAIADGNPFEERAENLSEQELSDWTTLTSKDHLLLRKLKGPGAKLLAGPRGCGKSTLMRLAYFQMLSGRDAFPVYVNYSQSLALEPLFHTHANAALIFRQWVLCKMALGARIAAKAFSGHLTDELQRFADIADAIITGLEKGQAPSENQLLLSPSKLAEELEQLCIHLKVTRVVLLLDDAAHAFSPEQQSEFFEIFRQLRTRYVAPKAAVYPGITTYSPNFHIGHEAEQLNAWYDADDPQYVSSMKMLVSRRFPQEIQDKLRTKQEQVQLLALCAFGIPRGFLNMLSALIDQSEEPSARVGWAELRPIIESHAESVRKIFRSLVVRLPKFKNFVEVGTDLEKACIEQLRRFNLAHIFATHKTTRVAIEEPLPPNLMRVLHMLEYSGLMRELGGQTRGSKGSYKRYTIHHALVASDNALALGRSFALKAVVDGLSTTSSQALVRVKAQTLLGPNYEERCHLSLLPCPRCRTDRAFADQRYCMKCGAELRDGSIYDELLRSSIENLPLPARKIDDIQQHTSIRTINDVLADEQQQLLKIRYVGPVWAKRIRSAAEEFVSM